MVMSGSHDAWIVMLSVIIAIIASYTAVDLAGRMRVSRAGLRPLWLSTAALVLGGGIWSMHFVAMLALRMPHPVFGYDLSLTLLSLVLAILCTGIGFAVVDRARGRGALVGAGLLMGLGVVAMHYVGMAAMRMPATIRYDAGWVAISCLIAIGAATAALWFAYREQGLRMRMAAALLMGLAIAGMHFAGMQAALFTPTADGAMMADPASVSQSSLVVGVTAITFVILALALGAATIDRRLSTAMRREARIALRLRLADAVRDASTDESLHETAVLMGVHFNVSRVAYGEIDGDDASVDYRINWSDGTVRSVSGRYPLALFGEPILTLLRAGKIVAIGNIHTDPLGEQLRSNAGLVRVTASALLAVPFLREGQLRAILYMDSREPRLWTGDDIGFMKEIAERTRQVIARAEAEKQLRDLNETLEQRVREAIAEREVLAAVVDNTSASVMVCDCDLNILALNNTQARDFQRVFGLACKVGDNLLDLLAAFPIQQAFIQTQWNRALAGEAFVIVDEFGGHANQTVHSEVHFHPMRDSSGTITGAFLTAYDVSDSVRARRDLEMVQEALRQSQKMEAMGQLTGGVAHDFNNLLTPILGTLDMLRRRGVGSERDQRLIAGAFQSADRAKVLVQRLLAFARRQPLQLVSVDIGRLVVGMTDLVASTTGPQIRVNLDVPDNLPPAQADPNQLEMALLNLAVNARDAMPDGGSLRISVRSESLVRDRSDLRAGDYICLSIADTGTGMDKATLARAIEPFFSTKGIGKGTGLGLSMVHGLASQLGGALDIVSHPGVGTNVELWLPQSAAAAPDAATAPILAKSAKQGRVLLVDDEELVRMSTAEMLDELGYSVIEAGSAEEACLMVDKGEPFDFLLTDHLMPGMTGTDLAQRVRSVRPDAPVLLISGYAELEGVAANIPRLTKPFCKDDLAASLADL